MEIPRFPDVLIDVDADITETNTDFVAIVHGVMVKQCSIWKSSIPTDIQLHRLTTANSNYVFIVRNTNAASIETSEPEKTMLRIYGKMNFMFDRAEEENVSIVLAEMGLMSRIYAVFGNGRVETYIDHTPVSPALFRQPATYREVAKKMRSIHSLVSTLSTASPEPLTNKMWHRFETLQSHASEASTRLLSRALEPKSRADMLREIVQWDVFQDHAAAKARAAQAASPLVFGHCDVHHGNVLNTSEGFVLIDFEYAMPTARGFDLANFFCEFCSDYDVEGGHEVSFELYPDLKTRLDIFRAYLSPAATELEVEQLEIETAAYLPFVHLQWAHWGLINAQESHCSSFDHLRYAYLRYKEFNRLTVANSATEVFCS